MGQINRIVLGKLVGMLVAGRIDRREIVKVLMGEKMGQS